MTSIYAASKARAGLGRRAGPKTSRCPPLRGRTPTSLRSSAQRFSFRAGSLIAAGRQHGWADARRIKPPKPVARHCTGQTRWGSSANRTMLGPSAPPGNSWPHESLRLLLRFFHCRHQVPPEPDPHLETVLIACVKGTSRGCTRLLLQNVDGAGEWRRHGRHEHRVPPVVELFNNERRDEGLLDLD